MSAKTTTQKQPESHRKVSISGELVCMGMLIPETQEIASDRLEMIRMLKSVREEKKGLKNDA